MLRHDPRFAAGLLLRLVAVLLLVPPVQAEGFTPFLRQGLAAPSLDPWTQWLSTGGDPLAFLYGPVMVAYHAPFVGLGMLADRAAGGGGALAQICFGLSLVLADLAMLVLLRRLHDGAADRVVAFYWLSPIVLVATYYFGEVDIVPTALVTASLLVLREGRPRAAGALLGAAIGANISALALLPFMAIFLWSHRRHRDTLAAFTIPCLALALALQAPLLLLSGGVQAMLLASAEVDSILGMTVPLAPGQTLHVMPFAYLLLLYGAWRVGRMSFDLLHAVLGAVYFVILLLTPASTGWYVWVLPFVVAYQTRAGARGVALATVFAIAFVLHRLLTEPGPALPLIGMAGPVPPWLPGTGPVAEHLAGLAYTATSAVGLVLAVTMLRHGLEENDFFRLSQRPLAIAIAGDSGTGKDTLALAIAGLFGGGAVTNLSGDDYHLFERHGRLWQSLTHLDPRANDLDGMARDAQSLLGWKPILCRHYDHATGLFTPRRRIKATDVVLVTGLHALYSPALRASLDLAIYLDMDDELRRFFKIRRDVRERGHPVERVLASLERRRPDYERFVQPQRAHADIVFALLPADRAGLADWATTGRIPLLLRVRLHDAVGHERVVRHLGAVCGAQVDVAVEAGGHGVELTIAGEDVSGEDLQVVVLKLFPMLSELLAWSPAWQPGLTGIMQLFVLMQLARHSPKRMQESRQ
ncbi:hypothetical protein JMJ56_24080 [Belnapia sp. T18]|uniref:phosphoribulokinase n=1 Tax=Belnapia arida TaxID=2804533 RepID=A0ABS1U990_9PROT|nr:glycosyltransferase 87 family protein [Belnapia arida]MBL6081090.1 hypothetical protein [Belnapia arida]